MKRAFFRFYAELNDFFPPEGDGKVHLHQFQGRQTVKDRIECLGVPHTEVHLILCNNEPVDFSYLVNDGDRIGVFPVFKTFVLPESLAVQPLYEGEPRFVLDTHLGKLARYLRILGFDTLYRNDYEDSELARISAEEERILLTRDHGVLKRKIVKYGYFIRYDHPRRQLKSVINRYGLDKYDGTFGRCLECNTRLVPVEKEKIMDRLEPKTKKYFDEFYICPNCNKIYWQGSHYEDMKEFIDEI